ncbi:transmembrane protein [Mycolicibacterium canariasense]|uniref:Transmembrane protein n=1 Tax=Mycolicibacterium canariasense TaxID=228230 RepID=A0A100W8I5_MYCCR|nr:hypothetical protein [Mycolicibacterium canariasense]MCV7213365.1 hypothetical protein [Mycolicibacterium canariasense]ORV10608.1 hypothetical protein AWB94_06810 [Mycolicibacterium canariasense]GAS93593.1 transmembrane protein [Mycolicibacterium canariasense]
MDSFIIGLGGVAGARLLSRNPLVRISDRIEDLAMVLAMVFVVLATPVAAAVGTAVHDTQAHRYADQAATRHLVQATAQDDTTVVQQRTQSTESTESTYAARARWTAAGAEHEGVVPWPGPAEAGAQTDIWVDSAGLNTKAPTDVRQAVSDAVAVAALLWGGTAAASAGSVWVVRRRLDRVRQAAWDRELAAALDGPGGRAPHRFDS